ncbi:accessory gene regulator B family protein [Brevibacillus laterosporus]|uniref:accessory gene regulator B family protein n=1 Tax=Brevibacillus laterosporus TaxID=1465 RepID=UPI000B9BBC99|nr:accessory gene regulator B family protein [Brevibacillus laterosporus]MCG7317669.1 accessory gene regulator B family protein [Brevibacillus laterosporus]
MVEKVAETVAKKINAAAPNESVSVDVLVYSLTIQLYGLAITISSLLVGAYTGKLLDTLIALVSFVILRLLSGGCHAKNMFMCYCVSTLVISLIPHLPIDTSHVIYLNVITFFLVAFYAPRSQEINNIPLSALPFFKVASILLVCIGFYLDSSIISLSLFAQAITLIPVLERGCQP